jgi:hypothetical protein
MKKEKQILVYNIARKTLKYFFPGPILGGVVYQTVYV